MIKLTVSVLNFNGDGYLKECLESISKAKNEAEITVYVVDNGSSDGSFEEAKKRYPSFKYIENDQNLGFSKANNQILKKLNTEYVLILNPDSKLTPGTIKYMLDFMEFHPEVGAASCRVEKKDGSIDWASHRGFPTPLASFMYYFLKNDSLYHLTNRDMSKTHEVDAIVGAFFLTRKSVLDRVGLFDEDYFMYGEDIDLCLRIKQAGYKVMYVPEVKILHYKGVSSGLKGHSQEITTANSESRKKALDAFYEAMKIFYKKHYEKKYPAFINWLIYLGINLKWRLAKGKMEV